MDTKPFALRWRDETETLHEERFDTFAQAIEREKEIPMHCPTVIASPLTRAWPIAYEHHNRTR